MGIRVDQKAMWSAPCIAIVGLIVNTGFLICETICMGTYGWVIGDNDMQCNLEGCRTGSDGDTSDYPDDCKDHTDGTIGAFVCGWVLFAICIWLSVLFVCGDRAKCCECLNKPGCEKWLTYGALVAAVLGVVCYLCGWANWIHNVINGDDCFGNTDGAEGGASIAFFVIIWFFRVPFPAVFWFGSDVMRGTSPGDEQKPDVASPGEAPPVTTDEAPPPQSAPQPMHDPFPGEQRGGDAGQEVPVITSAV